MPQPYIKVNKMGRKKKLCEKCKYRWEYTAFGWSEWGCQYIIVEGKPRRCECNDNCEKFKKKEGNRKCKLY